MPKFGGQIEEKMAPDGVRVGSKESEIQIDIEKTERIRGFFRLFRGTIMSKGLEGFNFDFCETNDITEDDFYDLLAKEYGNKYFDLLFSTIQNRESYLYFPPLMQFKDLFDDKDFRKFLAGGCGMGKLDTYQKGKEVYLGETMELSRAIDGIFGHLFLLMKECLKRNTTNL